MAKSETDRVLEAHAPLPVATPERDPRWALLAAPFPADQIELLPKPLKKDSPKGHCNERTADCNGVWCGGYHQLPCVHLSYVGHASVTDRLNEVDPSWNWEPVGRDGQGLPLISKDGLWIQLTVLGVTRLGFGDAQGKSGPNAIKEMIGDAIRNAAMRFGVATYLWSKSERANALRDRQGVGDDEPASNGRPVDEPRQESPLAMNEAQRKKANGNLARLGIAAFGGDELAFYLWLGNGGFPIDEAKGRASITQASARQVQNALKRVNDGLDETLVSRWQQVADTQRDEAA